MTRGWIAAALAVVAVAGCGGNHTGSATQGTKPAMQMPKQMAMRPLLSATRGDVKLTLTAMAPETFFVSDGASLRRHAPAAGDNAHMMVMLADAQTGIRLPDATVTLRIVGPHGRTAFDGPMYPMIGRGMGMHYGENVALPDKGRYTAEVVAGPPRIGRHMDVRHAWLKTLRVRKSFSWDGKPGS